MFTLIDIATMAAICLGNCSFGFFFYHTLTPKYSFRKTFLLSCLILSASGCISYADYFHMPWRQIFSYLIMTISCRILYADAWYIILFSMALLALFAFTCDFAVFLFLYSLFLDTENFPHGTYLLAGNLLFDLLFFICIYFFLLLWKKRKNALLSKSIYATILFPVSQFFMIEVVLYYVMIQSIRETYRISALLCVAVGVIFCIFADILLFQVMLDDSKKERLFAQLDLMNEQARRELQYYNSINEKIQEIRKIRHDFNNQLQTAYGAILKANDGGRETAAQLLGQLELQIEQAAPIYYCPNLIVNVILAEKVRAAKAQGISVDISAKLPEQLSIEKVDLCSIFSNLLDNAIHAAALSDSCRTITVNAWIKAGYCIIQVTNPFSSGSAPSGTPLYGVSSADRDEERHGYGLYILKSIAEKYHGEFTTDKKDGFFTANIKLKFDSHTNGKTHLIN